MHDRDLMANTMWRHFNSCGLYIEYQLMCHCFSGQSWRYLGFSTDLALCRDFFETLRNKNISLRPFKFGVWVDMGVDSKPIIFNLGLEQKYKIQNAFICPL